VGKKFNTDAKKGSIPFFVPDIGSEEIKAVRRVMRSRWLTSGPETEAFEDEFANFIGTDCAAVSVNSCTAGLHLVLEALGIGKGDQVLVPDLTFTATAEVVRYLGADPVFVDVDSGTLCIDLAAAAAAITKFTKAIIPVHFAGLPADLDGIFHLAERHSLAVVEDAAHALPAMYKGKMIGSYNSCAVVFSFYANKTLTTGEGGMIVSKDVRIVERCRIMRTHGIDRSAHERFKGQFSRWNYDVIAPGYKYNLTDLAAAIGRVQLKKAWELLEKRTRVAEYYDFLLRDVPVHLPPKGIPSSKHAWHIYVVQIMANSGVKRDDVLHVFEKNKIGYSVHYTPLHKLRYWRERYQLSDSEFPNTMDFFNSCLSLPFYPRMSRSDQRRCVEVLKRSVSPI